MALIWCETMEMITKRPLDLIRDTEFKNGFAIYGTRHEDGMWAQYAGVSKTTGAQIWNVAQWANDKHPLDVNSCRTNLENGGYIYETPTCRMDVRSLDDCLLRLELRASREYQGHIRRAGEEWPHLLIEQHDCIDFYPAMGDLKKLNYSISIMPEYCTCHMTPEQINPDLHCAQLSHYLAMWDPVAKDGFWFGISFWDNRFEVHPGYASEDVGKDDCTNKMIVVEPIMNYVDQQPALGQWTDVETDLLPHMESAVVLAKERGYLKNAKFERMKIFSTNLGLEITGNYDAAFKVRKLSLVGE